MSYTITATAVRPSGILWFNEYDNATSMSEINWVKSQPGYVSFTVVVTNPTTLVSTLVFEDQASYEAMAAARLTRTDWNARQDYCSVSGITKTVVKE